MFAAILLLILVNIIVWVLEVLSPYQDPHARVKRSGLLLVLYLPLWAITSYLLLALTYPLFYGRSYFQHQHSAITAVWVSLFLALVFALLHRPLLTLLGRCMLRGKQKLWGPASAVFGGITGALEYLIVQAHVTVGPIALVVYCAASVFVGYCVGQVRSMGPKQPPLSQNPTHSL